MDPAKLLRNMLNDVCPRDTYQKDGKEVRVHHFDLHCVEYEVHWTSDYPNVTIVKVETRSI